VGLLPLAFSREAPDSLSVITHCLCGFLKIRSWEKHLAWPALRATAPGVALATGKKPRVLPCGILSGHDLAQPCTSILLAKGLRQSSPEAGQVGGAMPQVASLSGFQTFKLLARAGIPR
jgi:hypothetical protein